MTDRLRDVLERLRLFVAERDWEQFHNPKNLAMAVASEAGELLAEYRWIEGDASDVWSSDKDNKQRVAAEAADVAIALLLLCDRIELDLVAAIEQKMDRNAANYPVAQSRGKHSRPS
jgi:NTP pyrophosphatase (non-canonical NTP hydrolase)